MKSLVHTFLLCPLLVWAAETITIVSPYAANHSGSPAMQKILDQANRTQNRYNFTMEFRPGGEQILAIQALDDKPGHRLAIIAPKFVEHASNGKLDKANYLPVHALGDACWAVISNLGDERQGLVSLRGRQEVVVGGVGVGNATHLTALQIAEKQGFQVRYVTFRSNFDALILMAGDNSINLVIDRVASFYQFRDRNRNLKLLAMSCPMRHPAKPKIRTLQEQGIDAPYVFNITVAHKNMDASKREEISRILQDATLSVGLQEIQRLSDMIPPVFERVSLESYYTRSFILVETLLKRHQRNLADSK